MTDQQAVWVIVIVLAVGMAVGAITAIMWRERRDR